MVIFIRGYFTLVKFQFNTSLISHIYSIHSYVKNGVKNKFLRHFDFFSWKSIVHSYLWILTHSRPIFRVAGIGQWLWKLSACFKTKIRIAGTWHFEIMQTFARVFCGAGTLFCDHFWYWSDTLTKSIWM